MVSGSKKQVIWMLSWSKRGEQCAESLHKGSPVVVEGYIRTRSYVDSNNQNRKITEIVANKVSFLEKTGFAPDQDSQPTSNTSNTSYQPKDSGANITDDDVPF
jgi:single-strand DNA-binding protein